MERLFPKRAFPRFISQKQAILLFRHGVGHRFSLGGLPRDRRRGLGQRDGKRGLRQAVIGQIEALRFAQAGLEGHRLDLLKQRVHLFLGGGITPGRFHSPRAVGVNQ